MNDKNMSSSNMMNIDEEKKLNADKSLRIAETAFSNGDLKKAERFLLKAQRLHPTTLGERMLEDVMRAQGQASEDETSSQSEASSTASRASTSSSPNNDVDIVKCLDIAREAIKNKDFEKADRFLLKCKRASDNPVMDKLIRSMEQLLVGSDARSAPTGTLEDAEKCIEIAQQKFANREYRKAKKFLEKAENFFPTARAKELMALVQDAINENPEEETAPIRSERRRSVQHPKQETLRPARKEPSKDEIETIRRVREARNDYDILGIQNPSTKSVVNKACRRLMLILHPDRNKAPGAKEAFMVVVEAADRIKKQLNN